MTLLFGNKVAAFQMQISDRIAWHSYSWKISCVFWLVVFFWIHSQARTCPVGYSDFKCSIFTT